MRMRSLVLVVSLGLPLTVFADCTRDAAPTIPDGSKATEAELIAAQKAVKAYVSSGNAYLACLDAEGTAAGPDEDKEKIAARTTLYNAAVDEMSATAAAFNAAAKAFKAAHP